jgi:hypothetical protein
LVLFSVVIMLINFGIDFAYRTFDQRIVVATPAALLPASTGSSDGYTIFSKG